MRQSRLLVATAVVVLGVTAGAAAHEVEHDSKVTARYADDAFSGKVISQSENCVAEREVRIIRVAKSGDRTVVATGTTDASGFYSIAFPDAPDGSYFARVGREVLRDNAEHTHACAPDRSNTFKVNSPERPAGPDAR
jgi:hypothetical protein